MRFAFSDEQLELQRVVRDFLTRECAASQVRAAWNASPEDPLSTWPMLASLGVVEIPRGAYLERVADAAAAPQAWPQTAPLRDH